MSNVGRHMHLKWSFLRESEMTAQLEGEIRRMLVAAFPQYADFFATTSYRGSLPEYRLIGRDSAETLVAHLECGARTALSAGQPVRILGIGSVATLPIAQGKGVGHAMFQALTRHATQLQLADFGFLECREAVAGFYESVGFVRTRQPCTSMHYETQERETYEGPVMVLPLAKAFSLWPPGGEVDLQGMGW
jgi:nodulation protein A